MNILLSEVLTAIVLVVLLITLVSGVSRLKTSLVSFGHSGAQQPMPENIRNALARQYMHQQAVAFGLVIAAILLGLLFSSGILYRVVFAKQFRLEDIGRAAALAGDIFLGRYATRSYREACNRAEKLIVAKS